METTLMAVSPIALLAVLFLPLFPFSAVFNLALRAARFVWLRVVLLLVWPQIGVWLIAVTGLSLPHALKAGLLVWAIGSSLFYAWRLLSTRDLDIWIGFYASSAWALAWIGTVQGVAPMDLSVTLGCMSVTALGLAVASHCVRRRWGDSYVGLRPGLARSMPRLGAAVTLTVLAALGAPLFPVFFAMLYLLGLSGAGTVAGLLLVWLMWSWAGAQIWQGFLFGPSHGEHAFERTWRDVPRVGFGLAVLVSMAAIVAAAIWSTTWLMH